MSSRTRKTYKVYSKFTRAAQKRDCDFCNFSPKSDVFIKEYKRFWLVRNLFPYDVWDTVVVDEHLMVVPKRHVDSIGHFNKVEQLEYTQIVGEYDLQGYALYARPKGSKNKSVPHQHSHLMKYKGKHRKLLIYLRKPHILIHK